MDWVSWLSKSNIEPSLAYEYGLAFAGNELEKEDIPYLNHEILQSMGISVAKHRLEIIKLARKETCQGGGLQNPSISKLALKFNKTKRQIAKRFNKIIHGDSTKALPNQSPWHQETWSGTILTKSKSQRDRKVEKMMVIQDDDDDDMLPRPSGPLDMRMQEGVLRHSKSLKVSGSSENRGQERLLFPNGSLDLSAHVDGRAQDNRQVLSNRKSRLSAPPNRQNNEKLNPFDEDDDDDEENGDHLFWRAVHHDNRRA